MMPSWASHKRLFFDVSHNPQAIVILILFSNEWLSTIKKKSKSKAIDVLYCMVPVRKKMWLRRLAKYRRVLLFPWYFWCRPITSEQNLSTKYPTMSVKANIPPNFVPFYWHRSIRLRQNSNNFTDGISIIEDSTCYSMRFILHDARSLGIFR